MKKGSVADGLVFHAGFPNAGEDQAEMRMSLDAMVFRHRLSTYLWKLEQAIPELGWQPGSVVAVDRALEPKQGDLVVAVADEDFVLRKLHKGKLYDMSGDSDQSETVSIWGVITHVLMEYRSA
ncbi:MAG TPA: hypothetical protein PLN95_01420 [Candidatus Saccharibacteria bacterium]|nr:hypothetical protein [Candidatus Saccharibacteria bacterium]